MADHMSQSEFTAEQERKMRTRNRASLSATIMDRPTEPPPGTDAYHDRQGADTARGLVTTTARQRFHDGRLGPMNITPSPTPMEDD